MPELQLLVIDLGDACVVKVEKGGQVVINSLPLPSVAIYQEHEPKVVTTTFDEVRKAIDGVKPVPRIELDAEGAYRFYPYAGSNLPSFIFNAVDIDALCQLAGKPLPIHEGGKWEQLVPFSLQILDISTSTPLDGGSGVKIWRYTR